MMYLLRFLFGGYSWIKKEFVLWKIVFDEIESRFVSIEAPWARFSPRTKGLKLGKLRKADRALALGRIAFAGDQGPLAKRLFSQEMTRRHRQGEQISKIEMEPFDIVVKMLRDKDRSPSIGGAPQLAKVYQFVKNVSFPLYWPDKAAGTVFLQGRPCLGYERLDTKIVDPDNHSWPTSVTEEGANKEKVTEAPPEVRSTTQIEKPLSQT